MVVHEAPKEAVPGGLPVAFGIVAHFHYVVAGTDVGLGGHEAAVGKLAHAVYVGNHDPVVGVDKEFHEPAVDFVGIDFAEEHEVAENHEAFDVVAVAGLEDGADGVVDGGNAGGGGVEGVGHGAGEVPEVAGAFFGAFGFVDTADEFAPADELADDAFGGVEGGVVLLGVGEDGVEDLLGLEQPAVDEGGEETVVEDGVVADDGVFVGAEFGEAVGEELVEPVVCLRMGEGIAGRGGERAEGVGKMGVDVGNGGLIVRRVGGELNRGWGAAFGIFFTVIGVVGPFSAGGLGFVFDEDVAREALLFVEDGLVKLFFGGLEEGFVLFGGVEK